MIAGKSCLKLAFRNLSQKISLLQVKTNKINFGQRPILNFSNLFKFSSTKHTFFVFSLQEQPQLLQLQLKYRAQQDVDIFIETIKSSTGILDQMNIFKIFKVMNSSAYNFVAYERFFELVNHYVRRKSDNMFLVLATVKSRMATYCQLQKDYQSSLQLFQEALEILQQCMVPQLLLYYSVYRQYGLLQHQIGNLQKAKQILTESVTILEVFLSQSDDSLSTNHYCKRQATAYNVLATVDEQARDKWVQKALGMWERYTENKFTQVQYAKTVANNLRKQLKQDKEKAQSYYHFNLYNFQSEEMKTILKRAHQQTGI